MSKLRVESFTISLDGFGAGPDQDLSNPLGVGGTSLHGWAMSTRTFQKNVFGGDGGATEGAERATSTPDGLEKIRLAEIEKWRPMMSRS